MGSQGLDVTNRFAAQFETYPERGFWGALWYVDDPAEPPYEVYEWRRSQYTVQIVWNHGDGDPLFGQPDSPVSMPALLPKLDDGGRKLDDREDFPGALAAGLVDPEGNMRITAERYRLNDDEGLAMAIEEAAVAITEAFLRHVPLASLAPVLKVSREIAGLIAYTEFTGRLVAAFDDAGLAVRAAEPDAEWRALMAMEQARQPPPVTVIGDQVALDLPPFAAMIWRDLPPRPPLRVPWW